MAAQLREGRSSDSQRLLLSLLLLLPLLLLQTPLLLLRGLQLASDMAAVLAQLSPAQPHSTGALHVRLSLDALATVHGATHDSLKVRLLSSESHCASLATSASGTSQVLLVLRMVTAPETSTRALALECAAAS
jgi:hypothetical protein